MVCHLAHADRPPRLAVCRRQLNLAHRHGLAAALVPSRPDLTSASQSPSDPLSMGEHANARRWGNCHASPDVCYLPSWMLYQSDPPWRRRPAAHVSCSCIAVLACGRGLGFRLAQAKPIGPTILGDRKTRLHAWLERGPTWATLSIPGLFPPPTKKGDVTDDWVQDAGITFGGCASYQVAIKDRVHIAAAMAARTAEASATTISRGCSFPRWRWLSSRLIEIVPRS